MTFSHSCPTCGGLGYEVVEHIDVRAEHHPDCSGACDSCCPIPVPEPRYEREHCSNPDCVDGVYPKAAVERAAKAGMDEFQGRDDIGFDHIDKRIWIPVALAIVRSFHNEGTE